ncbi:MAG TPA: hypothetical protein VG692_15630 [Gemmatimonadales bacterium]|nr:hypothetical protein [Gemmatimonadales bacterium]
MTMKRALQAVLIISAVGVLFSGVLLYQETCRQLIGACVVGESASQGEGLVLGYPPCLYGLVMYLLIAALAALGLRSGR